MIKDKEMLVEIETNGLKNPQIANSVYFFNNQISL